MVKIKTIKSDDENKFSEELEYHLNKDWELIGKIQIKETKKQSVVRYGGNNYGTLDENNIIFIATLKKILTPEEEKLEIENKLLVDTAKKLDYYRDWKDLVKNSPILSDDRYIRDNDLIINKIAKESQVDKSLIIKILQEIQSMNKQINGL